MSQYQNKEKQNPSEYRKAANEEMTIAVKQISNEVDEEILWELFTQGGPVTAVTLPRDRLTKLHTGIAYVQMSSAINAEYTARLLHGTKLFGQPILCMPPQQRLALLSNPNMNINMNINMNMNNVNPLRVGAKLYVKKLAPGVDVNKLIEVFSVFGPLVEPPTLLYDDAGEFRGAAFVEYSSFDCSDAAIKYLAGQFLLGVPIQLEYAFNPETDGLRHGSPAERFLALKRQQSSNVTNPF